LEIKPEKEREILHHITEAVIRLPTSASGFLRKAIWEYIMTKHPGKVDYGDFLIGIRKFINAGKMSNKEGFYNVHESIIDEFLENDPKIIGKKN